MPRRKIPQIVKSSEDVLKEVLACPAPQILKTDRIAEFLPYLVKKRRLGSTWNDLTAALSDRLCRYSSLEVKAAVESFADDPAYDADAEIAKRLALVSSATPPTAPANVPQRPKKTGPS